MKTTYLLALLGLSGVASACAVASVDGEETDRAATGGATGGSTADSLGTGGDVNSGGETSGSGGDDSGSGGDESGSGGGTGTGACSNCADWSSFDYVSMPSNGTCVSYNGTDYLQTNDAYNEACPPADGAEWCAGNESAGQFTACN